MSDGKYHGARFSPRQQRRLGLTTVPKELIPTSGEVSIKMKYDITKPGTTHGHHYSLYHSLLAYSVEYGN